MSEKSTYTIEFRNVFRFSKSETPGKRSVVSSKLGASCADPHYMDTLHKFLHTVSDFYNKPLPAHGCCITILFPDLFQPKCLNADPVADHGWRDARTGVDSGRRSWSPRRILHGRELSESVTYYVNFNSKYFGLK